MWHHQMSKKRRAKTKSFTLAQALGSFRRRSFKHMTVQEIRGSRFNGSYKDCVGLGQDLLLKPATCRFRKLPKESRNKKSSDSIHVMPVCQCVCVSFGGSCHRFHRLRLVAKVRVSGCGHVLTDLGWKSSRRLQRSIIAACRR